jgi:hypothetical protein
MRLKLWVQVPALLAFLCWATPAHADPISAAILTFAFGAAAATPLAVAATSIALQLAAGLGLSYLAAMLNQPEETTPVGGTSGKMQSGGIVPRSFVVGTAATAGSLVYVNTRGTYNETPNALLYMVIALSDIPVTRLAEVIVNGERVTWNPATPDGVMVAIPQYTKNGQEYLWISFYNGTQTQADAGMVSRFGNDPDYPYESNRVGTGVAYAICRALIDDELWTGFPEFKFVLDGIKLYDRRFDATAGGVGPQRWNDPATWQFTANNITIVENVLRGIRYAGSWVYGAQTLSENQIPFAAWSAAMNECNVDIALDGGGTEKQYYAGGEIKYDDEPVQAISELLKGCNGRLAEIGGIYKPRAGAPGSSVFAFTDDDILSTDRQVFEPFPSLGDVINHVEGRYTSPADAWNIKDAPALVSPDLEAADDGRRQSSAVTYGFVTSGTMVQRLMKSERDTNRAWRRHVLPMPPEAFVLEPLDVITWNSTRNGYENKLFEILSAEDLPNFNMQLTVRELDPNAYDWDEAVDEQPIEDGTIVITRPPSQPIIAWTVAPAVITLFRCFGIATRLISMVSSTKSVLRRMSPLFCAARVTRTSLQPGH